MNNFVWYPYTKIMWSHSMVKFVASIHHSMLSRMKRLIKKQISISQINVSLGVVRYTHRWCNNIESWCVLTILSFSILRIINLTIKLRFFLNSNLPSKLIQQMDAFYTFFDRLHKTEYQINDINAEIIRNKQMQNIN